MGLGSLLGAAAGLLIPGGGALTAAIGSGIGSLIEGEDPKDAIKNALLAGTTAAVFPNAARALQNSGFGQTVTQGLGSLGIGTRAGLEGLRGTTAVASSMVPVPRPSNLGQVVRPTTAAAPARTTGILGDLNLGQISAGLLAAGGAGIGAPQQELSFGPPEGFGESGGLQDDVYANLYANKYTGERFSTPEERDASERLYEEQFITGRQLDQYEVGSSDYTQIPSGGMTFTPIQPYRMGGMIEGPGTVTSDSIPGMIMQNGRPVEQIAVSNGEVILSGKDLAGLDPDGDMERAARKLDSVPNGSRGAMAAKMYADMMDMRKRA